MKVFVSHKREDVVIATAVSSRLKANGADVYLDAFDPDSFAAGDDLAEYLRAKLTTCSDLMAVVSNQTKASWWVPWEIGVATEKEYPLSTYAGNNCEIPIYLKKWPYLRTFEDLDEYVAVSRQARRDIKSRYSYKSTTAQQSYFVRQFHRTLKQALGQ